MFLNVALCSEYGRAESNKLKKKERAITQRKLHWGIRTLKLKA